MNLHDIFDDGSPEDFEPIDECYEELCDEVVYLLSGHRDRELWELIEEDRKDRGYYGKPLSRVWKQGRSLRGGLALTETAVHGGSAEALAAVDAWRFKANRATIIRVVSREEFAAMAERSAGVVFHG